MQQNKSAIASRLRHDGRNLDQGLGYLAELQEPQDTPESVQELANLAECPVEVLVADNVPGGMSCWVQQHVKPSPHILPHPKEPFTRSTLLALQPPRRYRILQLRLHLLLTRHSHIGVWSRCVAHAIYTSQLLQDEYPVLYFFYGTLTEPETLYQKLDLDEMSTLKPAVVRGGKVKGWSGKHRALVNAEEKDEVAGWLYVVETKAHEDELRMYQGRNYEVVRYRTEVEGGETMYGLTFRFCGDVGALADE